MLGEVLLYYDTALEKLHRSFDVASIYIHVFLENNIQQKRLIQSRGNANSNTQVSSSPGPI